MRRLVATGLGLLWTIWIAAACQAEEAVFAHEHVLGTSLELRIDCPGQAEASVVESTVLTEIDRLDKVFSRYRSDSELMRWQRQEVGSSQLSGELRDVLIAAEAWRVRTGGAFDIRAGALVALWKQAESAQQLPSDAVRQHVTSVLRGAPWGATFPERFERNDRFPISLDAIAKGYILDALCNLVRERFKGVKGFTIQIGGDLRKMGNTPLKVAVASATNATEGAAPASAWTQAGPLALASSGDFRRGFDIQGRHYSHIFDPRTGFPAQGVRSATVIAPTAMEADAAATAISVLGLSDGLRLIESLPDFSCLIQTADGREISSRNWPGHAPDQFALVEDEPVPKDGSPRTEGGPKTGLLVDFTLAPAAGGGRYRRPYVAVWLEDKDGFPVKTAVLWIMTQNPGPRWHRDLTRWYRNDKMRELAEQTAMIGAISSPTRGPGDYQTRFDGVDNDGKPLPPGKYTLCIEAAREHGSYQIIKEPIDIADKPLAKKALKGNTEISAASYQYVPWKPRSAKESPAK